MLSPQNKNFKDKTGMVFGKLTALRPYGRNARKIILWLCKCECGNTAIVVGTRLGTVTNSCGCIASDNAKKHGETKDGKITPEYRAFSNARTRCNNPKSSHYSRYGGRGIKFLFNSFREFIDEVGRKPSSKHSLDRINPNLHYQKGNLRWSVKQIQAQNTEKGIFLEIDGETKHLSEWAEIYQIKRATLWKRISENWCSDCAVKTPIGKGHCVHKKPIS